MINLDAQYLRELIEEASSLAGDSMLSPAQCARLSLIADHLDKFEERASRLSSFDEGYAAAVRDYLGRSNTLPAQGAITPDNAREVLRNMQFVEVKKVPTGARTLDLRGKPIEAPKPKKTKVSGVDIEIDLTGIKLF